MSTSIETEKKYTIVVSGEWIVTISRLINESKKPFLDGLERLDNLNEGITNGMLAGDGLDGAITALEEQVKRMDLEIIESIKPVPEALCGLPKDIEAVNLVKVEDWVPEIGDWVRVAGLGSIITKIEHKGDKAGYDVLYKDDNVAAGIKRSEMEFVSKPTTKEGPINLEKTKEWEPMVGDLVFDDEKIKAKIVHYNAG